MFYIAKLWKKGEPVCIQITGFLTNITNWEKGLRREIISSQLMLM